MNMKKIIATICDVFCISLVVVFVVALLLALLAGAGAFGSYWDWTLA